MISPSIHSFAVALLVFFAELILSVIYPSLPLRLLLGIFAVYFVWKSATYDAGSNSPIGIYVIASSIYVFAALTEVAYFGNRLNFDPQLMGALTDMGVAFLLCVVAGYLLVDGPKGRQVETPSVNMGQVLGALWASAGLFVLTAMMTFTTVGFSIGELSRTDIYSQDLGVVSVLRATVGVGLGITAALLVAFEATAGKPWILVRVQLFLVLALYVLQDLLIFGDRRLPLMALLAVGCLFLKRRFSWTQVLTAAAFSVVLFTYGYVRNTPPSTWWATLISGDILQVISPASTEFGGMAIIGQSLGGFTGKFWNFPDYSDAFLQILPRSLLPDRPLAPTQWFMDTFYPELSAAGASYAFNQVIEARINAGIFGILSAGMLTGVTIALLSRVRYLGAPIGFSLALYIFSFSMRMDFASILRTVIVALAGAGIVLAIASALRLPAVAARTPWLLR